MEQLSNLATEYEAIMKAFAFPFNTKERQQLKDRREAILVEARLLAQSLNVVGTNWFESVS